MGRKKCEHGPVSDADRFWKAMNTPLCEVSDEDLVWASRQDGRNSYYSKSVWLSEIERRKTFKNKKNLCSTQKQQ